MRLEGSQADLWKALVLAGVLAVLPSCSDTTTREAGSEAAATTETAAKPVPSPAPKPLWQQHLDELQPEVEAWARAWSNQDVDAYLSHYSPDFVPPGGLSREAWEARRRDRLTRPSRVAVAISEFRQVGFKKKWTGGRRMELVKVQFRQVYESDSYSDEVAKVLELELTDLTWKIVTEASL
ncbi:MAG: hypothetical protein ACE5GX_20550 [Thermoanaerobaculia bacterium]